MRCPPATPMKRALLVMLLPVALACEPWGPLPGGQLSGTVSPAAPSDWMFADDFEVVQLETRPSSDPYSVNVWGAGIGQSFYVAAGRGEEADWAHHIVADPEVRLRIGDTIYELRAEFIQEDEEKRQFLEAVTRKYDFEPTEEQRESAWLFRLVPR